MIPSKVRGLGDKINQAFRELYPLQPVCVATEGRNIGWILLVDEAAK